MPRILRSFVIMMAAVFCLPSLVNAAVGYTSGSFKVSDTGAATYTIPIAVPPGTAGMQPSMALNYSSHSGNGPLGVGWSLSGLSAITRCPQTTATDGNQMGVKIAYSDRFCLDGQRLILKHGTYGNDSSYYRTERDTLTKIVAFGTAGNGPSYFIAHTKSGQTIQYGNSTDSKVLASGTSTVAVWAANRISDTITNYLTISYCQYGNTAYCDTNPVPATGEYYPARIDYAGNTAQSAPTSSSVRFVYTTRTDTFTGYVENSTISSTVRLSNVKVYEGANLIRDYRLAFDNVSSTGRSRLNTVTECDGNNNCLPSTTLTWQNRTLGFAAAVPTSTAIASYAQALDVNGDGFQDLVFCTSATGTWQVMLGQSASPYLGTPISSTAPCTGYQNAQVIRYYTGAPIGQMALLVPHTASNDAYWYLVKWTGTDFTNASTSVSSAGYLNNPQIMDVNGDKLPDLVQYFTASGATQPTWQVNFGTNTGGFQTATVDSLFTDPNYMTAKPIDFDGDGRWDLLTHNSGLWYFLQSISTGTSPAGNVFTPAFSNAAYIDNYNKAQVMDINGDGQQDLFLTSAGTGLNWYTYLLSDFNLRNSTVAAVGWASSNKYQLDYNGDGRTDLLIPRPPNGCMFFLSSGSSLNTYTTYIPGTTNWGSQLIIGDFNGDGLPDVIPVTGTNWSVALQNGPVPDLLTAIANGLGATTTITYKPLTDSTVYTRHFPNVYYQFPMYVVSQYTTSNGINGTDLVTYSYTSAAFDANGRGFVGFSQITSTDTASGIDTQTSYGQIWPTTGMALSITKLYNGQIISSVTNVNSYYVYGTANAYYYFPYVSKSTVKTYELPGGTSNLISKTVTTNTYNSSCATNSVYCDLTTIAVATTAGSSTFTKTTTNTYDYNFAGSWILGRLADAQVTSTLPSGQTLTRESSFTYDPTTGLLLTETIEPNGNIGTITNIKQTTTYTYDGFGNKSSATVSGADILSRTTSADYITPVPATATVGRFLYKTTNALNQTETHEYDARFGTMTKLTGPNVLLTQWQFDSFGRKQLETRADGTTTNWTYTLCVTGCPTYAKYYVTQTTSGAPTVIVYYDLLDREVRTQTQGYNGTAIWKDTVYNNLGQVDKVSRPYYSTEAPWWTYFGYDTLGRAISQSLPTQASTAGTLLGMTSYNGLTTTATQYRDGTALTTTQVKDALGQLVSVTDADNKTTRYEYDPFGNLAKVTDPALNSVTMTYDIRGRKLTMTDPDMGYWQYGYNSVGELSKQTDAKGQVVDMTYDPLGRLETRNEPEGLTTWIYDDTTLSGAKGKGKLSKVIWPGGNSRTYTYDDFGRPKKEITTLSGTDFTLTSAYDLYSRLDTITYPSGFMVRNNYNAYGYLSSLTNAATGANFWNAPAYNAAGQATAFTLGNGLTTVNQYDPATGLINGISTGVGAGSATQYLTYGYDTLGNFKSRIDGNQANLTETFIYDNLNRMTDAIIAGGATKTVGYDSIGNITSKSDVGTYTYDPLHKHAVKTAGTGSYTYDANGNQLTGSDGRTVTYTSFNQPISITANGKTNSFTYDGDHQRLTQTEADSSFMVYIRPRIDLGAHYEQKTKANGVVEKKNYIYAGKETIGVYTTRSVGSPDMRYFHKDHLGSIDTITNESGGIVERLSYDAWGKRRNGNWTDATTTITSLTHHGFTGHEMLDDLGLIHMNGRVYDPTLGRFIQADPTVQAPGNPQTLNRYSYAGNNPLTYLDPSGYGFFSSLWKGIKSIFKVVVTVAAIVVAAWWLGPAVALQFGLVHGTIGFGVVSGMVGGFAGGFLATYAITGDVRAAMYGGLTGVVMGGVGAYTQSWGFASKVLTRSTAGGFSSVLQGGKFKYGFKFTAYTESLVAVYDHMAMRTDKLGKNAADADGAQMGTDRLGSARIDGTTGVVNVFGERAESQSLLGKAGLTMEDQLAVGSHWYDRPGMLGSTSRALYVPELINAVGKVHDYLNSWNYNSALGKYITRGPLFDTGFDVYSFAGMVPAAQFTSMYLAGSTGGGGALLAVQLEERKWCTVCDR